MASISDLVSSSVLQFQPIPRIATMNQNRKTKTCTTVCAMRRDRSFNGKQVDEDMIVLRQRIHEMKMFEMDDDEPPVEWMEWEKRIYANYDMIICDLMGNLQSQLMETRPSLALGVIAIIILSVTFSTGFVTFNLLETSKGVLSGIHLS